MPLFQLSQRLRLEVQIPLDEQPQRTSGFLQFLEREAAVLDLESRNKAEEDVFPIELTGIPGPVAVWSEEFNLG
jgi:hypothetical protein